MRVQAVLGILFVASVLAVQEESYDGLELDYDESSVRRDKRTLTTICVEIKPSTPYEEPYFMCKGTDMPGYSKGGSHDGSESESSDYSKKPTYKPSSSAQSDYHGPVKTNYYPEPAKYEKPSSYSSPSSYSPSPSKQSYEKKPSYASYDAPAAPHETKPSYSAHESAHDDYSKPVHSPVYEKPSYHKESAYPSKPSYESSSYGHSESAKPSYAGSSYGHSESAKPSYAGSYGHSETSYNPPKSEYNSKPSSPYPAKYTSYEHAEKPSYAPVKSSYSEQYPAKSPPKPSTDYYKPTSKPYAAPEKVTPSKNGHPSPSQGYRMSPEEVMQPVWGLQGTQDGVFGYRSMDSQADRFNFDVPRMVDQRQQMPIGLDEPIRMDLTPSQADGPTLQSTYRNPVMPPVPYGTVGSPYGHAAPYAPMYPSYESAVSPYVPPAVSYPPATAPAPMYPPPAPAYSPSYGAPCPQSYLYSFQPAFISVPCMSTPPSYGQPSYSQSTYGHPLGASRSSDNKSQPDHTGTRDDYKQEPAKSTTDDSNSEESHEHDEKSKDKPETSKTHPMKPETPKNIKPTESQTAEKKPQEQPAAGADKTIDNQGNPKTGHKDASDTKAAYDAMVKMAKIAAQLNKDDANKGANNNKQPDNPLR